MHFRWDSTNCYLHVWRPEVNIIFLPLSSPPYFLNPELPVFARLVGQGILGTYLFVSPMGVSGVRLSVVTGTYHHSLLLKENYLNF